MLILLPYLIGLSSLIMAYPSQAAERELSPRRVTVQGHGKASAVPDQARLSVEVVEEGPRVDSVTDQIRRKMDAVLKALKAQGLGEKEIQTQFYRVTPKVEWRNGRSVRNGYIVSNTVEAVVNEVKKTGAVLSAVLEAGANNVNGPNFEFSRPQEVERKALEAALIDAKAKAILLAQTAGAAIGEVIEIQEGAPLVPPRPMKMMPRLAMAEAAAAPAESIALGENTVETTVTASFALK